MVNVLKCCLQRANIYVVSNASKVSTLVKNVLASLRLPCRDRGLISETVGDAALE